MGDRSTSASRGFEMLIVDEDSYLKLVPEHLLSAALKAFCWANEVKVIRFVTVWSAGMQKRS